MKEMLMIVLRQQYEAALTMGWNDVARSIDAAIMRLENVA